MAADGTPSTPDKTHRRRIIASSFEKASVPEDWDRIRAHSNGVDLNCFYARAKGKPTAIVFFVSGLQSSPLARSKEIDELRAQGISVISMALHPETDPLRYVDLNRKILHELIFRDSILHSFGDQNLPRLLSPHSTGAFLAFDLLTQPGHAENACNLFDGIVYLHPFFDMGSASPTHNPFRSLIYSAFASHYRNAPILSTRFEKAMTRDAQGPKEFYYDTPRHCLITAIINQARSLQDAIFYDQRPAIKAESFQSLPQICLLGAEDTMVCNKTAEDIMNRAGIEIRVLAGNHGASLEHPKSRTELIKLLQKPNLIQTPCPKHLLTEPDFAQYWPLMQMY